MAHIKNRLRGLLAAFVALVAALAIVPGVAKAELVDFDPPIAGSVTITGEDVTVNSAISVYQVATIKVDNETNVPGYDYANGMQDAVLNWVDKDGDASSAADLVAAVEDNRLSAMSGLDIAAGDPNGVVISGLVPGIYYIDIADTEEITYQDIVVAIEPNRASTGNDWVAVDEEVAVKSSDTTLEKTAIMIGEDDVVSDGSDVAAVLGDKITFRVNFTLSKNMTSFYLEDAMTGMTFADDVQFYTADNQQINSGFEVISPIPDSDVTFRFNIGNVSTDLAKYFVGDSQTAEFYITYSGIVNDEAIAGNDGAKNKVTSSVNSKGDEVTVDLASLTITKFGDTITSNDILDENEPVLVGAEFSLYTRLNEDGTAVDPESIVTIDDKSVFSTNESGQIVLDKVLDPTQTYYLVETKAPSGYKLSEGFTTITFGDDEDVVVKIDVPNDPLTDDEGVDLPETGGMGTIALTAAGVVLVAGAAAFIVRSRKEN